MDPDSLPKRRRLPDCLEGIPIQIKEAWDPTRANTFTAPECTRDNTPERRNEMFEKHESLIKSYPNSTDYFVGRFTDAYGRVANTDNIDGIVIQVAPWVDPDSLPTKQRVPECLEGIPVQIREGGIIRLL